MYEPDSIAYLFVYSCGCSFTTFLRSITGGDVQYNPRTKLTIRGKVMSFIRYNTCLGKRHMFCETGYAFGSREKTTWKKCEKETSGVYTREEEKKTAKKTWSQQSQIIARMQKPRHGLGRDHNGLVTYKSLIKWLVPLMDHGSQSNLETDPKDIKARWRGRPPT